VQLRDASRERVVNNLRSAVDVHRRNDVRIWQLASSLEDLITQGKSLSPLINVFRYGDDISGLQMLLIGALKGLVAYACHVISFGVVDPKVAVLSFVLFHLLPERSRIKTSCWICVLSAEASIYSS
jgi:hypothetical protein